MNTLVSLGGLRHFASAPNKDAKRDSPDLNRGYSRKDDRNF